MSAKIESFGEKVVIAGKILKEFPVRNLIRLFALAPILLVMACARPQLTSGVTTTPPGQPTPVVNPLITATSQPVGPIVYYSFVPGGANEFLEGSIEVLPNELILAPTPSNMTRNSDIAMNITSALGVMLKDARNRWTGKGIGITSVAFRDGHADVSLQGEIIGAGDVVLIAARMQILMTVFAERAVQTANVSLNGESIANLGISNSSEAKPAGYTFTRAEIETYQVEHAVQKRK